MFFDCIVASHINLLASKSEGLPMVMTATMPMDKTCVMINSDEDEVIAYGKYGFLTPIGDYKAITEKLEKNI